MKLSLIARNILQEAAANPGGIRLTGKTVLLLEERGAITRAGDIVQITEVGLQMLEGAPPKRKSRKAESLDLLRRELVQSRHEVATLKRELNHLRANSLVGVTNLIKG